MSSLLSVVDLEVRYGEALALSGISLEVPAGSAVAVLGPNGAGKSSLASAIVGLVRPALGRVMFDGTDITGWSTHRISRLGITHVPEGRGVFPSLPVIDNLRMMLHRALPRRERRDAVERALQMFPVLASRRRQMAGTLSGGEQQMLTLARVLAVPPRLLVADEMSLGLAPKLIDSVFENLCTAKAAGVSIVLIEQFIDRALTLADSAIVLKHGAVCWAGSAEDAGTAAREHYLGSTA